jgi:hypothetical protein
VTKIHRPTCSLPTNVRWPGYFACVALPSVPTRRRWSLLRHPQWPSLNGSGQTATLPGPRSTPSSQHSSGALPGFTAGFLAEVALRGTK